MGEHECKASQLLLVKFSKEVKTLLNINCKLNNKNKSSSGSSIIVDLIVFLLLEISVRNRKVTVCILDHSMHHLAGIQLRL